MKKLDRRTLLRGAGGIALSLPFLEAMGSSKFSGNPPVRTAFFYMPNGIGPNSIWNPNKVGKDYDLPSSLAPLAPVKNLVNVHTGLNGVQDKHQQSTSSVLTGFPIKNPVLMEVQGVSIDQLIAKEIGDECYLPSLELSIDRPNTRVVPNVENKGLGCYVSWSSRNNPVPREINPANAFNRLFQDLKSSGRKKNSSYTKSVLDYIKDDANHLKRKLGREDQSKVNQYFYSVRQIERRLEKLAKSKPSLPKGTKAPDSNIRDRWEKVRAMVDIMVLAFQTDRTRVASFMFANSGSGVNYSFLPGVASESHHTLSHFKDKKNYPKYLAQINGFLISFYVEMIKKMSVIQEDNGTLLDNSLLLFTSGLKDAHHHRPDDLPALVAGSGGGSVKTGYHHNHSGKNFSSLLLGMAKTAGCKINSFATTKDAVI